MRVLVKALRGYTVVENGRSFLCLQVKETNERTTVFRLPSPELPIMLNYLDKWTDDKGDPTDIDAANRRLESFRIASDSLQQLDAEQADHAAAIEASRFGSDAVNLFFDVIFSNGNKREYLLDLVAAQGLAAAIEDHLSVSPFLG